MGRALHGYIATLRRQAEDLRTREADNKPSQNDPRVLCVKSVAQQIEELMRSLPPAQRDRAWSMDELVARLHGRYKVRPCAGEIGTALRRQGWTRVRDWGREGGGRRVWIRKS